MCLFISAVVPREASLLELQAVAERHRLAFVVSENPAILAQLRPGERHVVTTHGHCDCGSPLFFDRERHAAEKIEREARELRKKGWGEAKIASWVASRRPRPHQPGEWHERCWTATHWADFLTEALGLPGARYIGVIGRWDRGDSEEAALGLKGRVAHPVDQLRHGLGALEQDIIHEFRL